ncbi:hypothetical protein IVB36_38835 [Bradyrhizobium sp. 35]|uniref:hypothetical protein n=1 Tax=Bradyrhizobium sp. 35 TaxID=2782670 RepID=UPI001FFA9CA8|nr:hypothetical protein [Bradyrhizobium sp. 35]MCK1456682.1 hypothetical protein [Bradyrhizobium sp. 35]
MSIVIEDIIEEIGRVAARLAAVEAVSMQIMAPLLEAVEPGLAAEVIACIRVGVNLPSHTDHHRLAAEEYLQRLADSIEARVRAKMAGR